MDSLLQSSPGPLVGLTLTKGQLPPTPTPEGSRGLAAMWSQALGVLGPPTGKAEVGLLGLLRARGWGLDPTARAA